MLGPEWQYQARDLLKAEDAEVLLTEFENYQGYVTM